MNITNWSRVDTRWYLAACCEKCRAPILFAVDHSDGSEEPQPQPADKLVLTCTQDTCRHKGDYTAAAILRFQKQPGAKSATGRNNEARNDRQRR